MEHEHVFTQLFEIGEGASVDRYSRCTCGWVRHTYTCTPQDPKQMIVQYVNDHSAGSWTAGFVDGYLWGQEHR